MPLKPPPKTDPIVAGWLALGPVAVEMARNPMHAGAALASWKQILPAAPRQRQRAAARAKPDCRRHRVSRSDRAAAAAVGSRRGGRRGRARRLHRRLSRTGPGLTAAFEDLRRCRRNRRRRLPSRPRRRRRFHSRPADQGGCGGGRSLEQRRAHTGACAQFPRRLGERRARFLSIRAVAGGRGAQRRTPAGGRRQAQGRRHHSGRRMGQPGSGGFRGRIVTARRDAARQRPLRGRARRFLRHHQADPAGARASRASHRRIAPTPTSCSWPAPPRLPRA